MDSSSKILRMCPLYCCSSPIRNNKGQCSLWGQQQQQSHDHWKSHHHGERWSTTTTHFSLTELILVIFVVDDDDPLLRWVVDNKCPVLLRGWLMMAVQRCWFDGRWWWCPTKPESFPVLPSLRMMSSQAHNLSLWPISPPTENNSFDESSKGLVHPLSKSFMKLTLRDNIDMKKVTFGSYLLFLVINYMHNLYTTKKNEWRIRDKSLSVTYWRVQPRRIERMAFWWRLGHWFWISWSPQSPRRQCRRACCCWAWTQWDHFPCRIQLLLPQLLPWCVPFWEPQPQRLGQWWKPEGTIGSWWWRRMMMMTCWTCGQQRACGQQRLLALPSFVDEGNGVDESHRCDERRIEE